MRLTQAGRGERRRLYGPCATAPTAPLDMYQRRDNWGATI